MVETAEILSRIDSMDPAAAGADKAEIGRIAAAAKSAASRLAAAFGDGTLEGVAARASTASSVDLSRQIDATSSILDMAQGWLSGAGSTLGSTVAFRPRIAAVEAMGEPGNSAVAAARTALASQLTGVFNAPMARSAGEVSGTSMNLESGAARQGAGAAGLSTDGADAGSGPVGGVPQSDGSGDVPPATAPQTQTPTGPTDPGSRPAGETPTSSPPPGAGPPTGASPGPSASPVGSDPRSGGPAASAPVGVPLAAGPVSGVARPVAGISRVSGPGSAIGRPMGPLTAGAGSPGLSTTTPGTASSGTASSATSSAAPASTSANASSTARPGQAPYGAGPTARRTDDQRAHRPADYLRSTTEGMLVLGPQPVVGPAVIGHVVVQAEVIEAVDEADPRHSDTAESEDDQELDLTL